ncbi:CHASE domain-containing protein [Aestuariispira ectoiniformans]|uniref:CHASE domain-containing protein n=1 Tax=Aestuariispira ectoiniformans TaxID=2775080 RepID=UPI00223ACE8C|nr:CHASE domain-containing protein [Aestuariispira ectoiniformans]
MRLIAIAVTYFLLGYVGLQLPYYGTTVTLVWAPAGVALAVMLLYGYRIWPAVYLGALLVNFTTDTPALTNIMIAAGNTLAAVTGTWLLRTFKQDGRLTHSVNLLLFILLGAVISPLIAAVNGALTLCLTTGTGWGEFLTIVQGWWLGDGVGVLFFGPFTLLALTHPWRSMSRTWYLEGLVLPATAGLASLLIHNAESFASPEILYLFGIIPFLVWAAVRCGLLGVAAINALSVAIAIFMMSRGTSAVFSNDDIQGNIRELYNFQIVIAVASFLVAAYVQRKTSTIINLAGPLESDTGRGTSSHILTIGAAVVGIALSVAASLVALEQIDHTQAENALEQAQRLEGTIRHEADLVIAPLFTIKTLFETQKEVTRESFETYIAPWVDKTPTVAALEWVARVHPGDRDAFEKKMRQLGYKDFQITEKVDGKLVRAPARDIYFPVTYVVPYAPNAPALGYAPDNLETRRNAIKQALSSGDVAMSNVISLVQQKKTHNGLLVFLPTFSSPAPDGTRINTGFALGIYDLDIFFEHLFQRLPAAKKLNIRIVDYEDGNKERLLYNSAPTPDQHQEFFLGHEDHLAQLDMVLAGQRWRIDVDSKQFGQLHGVPYEVVGILLLGLLLTTALTVYFHTLHRRRDEVQALVEIRTRELYEAKSEVESALLSAREANKAKSLFLAQMSHELRTPLNAIIGYVDLIRSHPHGPLGHTMYEEYLGHVKKAGKHLHDLIGDVLDMVKIETKNLELEHISFRLTEILDELRSVFSISAAERNNHLSLLIDSTICEGYLGDPTRLRQILSNLLSNAAKFTENGNITLRVETLSDMRNAQRLKISVTDTGIGIEPGQIARLFENFTQADSSIRRRYGGSGMGLAISKRLTQAMGGNIGVDSIPGQGSTFWITLTLDKASAAQNAQATEDDADSLRPLTLLLADDVAINRALTTNLLATRGHHTDTASNGIEALEAVKHKTYDAILMDIHMPEMDGMEATQAIRALADPERAQIPIIALTADVDKDKIRQYKASGMDDICPKPLDIEKLQDALRHVVGDGPAAMPGNGPEAASAKALEMDNSAGITPDVNTLAINDDTLKMALEMVPDAAALFEQEGSKQIQMMRNAITNENWSQLARAAHTLKGVAGNIGLTGLSRECQALQSQASNAEQGTKPDAESTVIQHQFDRIEQGYRSANIHIRNIGTAA